MISLNLKPMSQLNSYPAFRGINQPKKTETNALQQNITFQGSTDSAGDILFTLLNPILGPVDDFVEGVKKLVKKPFEKTYLEEILSANPELNKVVKEIINAPTDDAVTKYNEIIHSKGFADRYGMKEFEVSRYLKKQLSDSACKSPSEAKIKALITLDSVGELIEKKWLFDVAKSKLKSIKNIYKKPLGISQKELKQIDDAIIQVLSFKDEKLQQQGKKQIEYWCSSKLDSLNTSGMSDIFILSVQKVLVSMVSDHKYLEKTFIPKLKALAKSCKNDYQ